MNDIVIFVQDLSGCSDRARCRHCKHRLLYSKVSSVDYESSRFICLALNRKFINGRGFACQYFEPKIGYKVLQSNLQLNLQL